MADIQRLSQEEANDDIVDYMSHLSEVLGFLAIYRDNLTSFLEKGDYRYSQYEEEMNHLDDAFKTILDTLQSEPRRRNT